LQEVQKQRNLQIPSQPKGKKSFKKSEWSVQERT